MLTRFIGLRVFVQVIDLVLLVDRSTDHQLRVARRHLVAQVVCEGELYNATLERSHAERERDALSRGTKTLKLQTTVRK